MAKILVVDDEPDLRFILRHYFEQAGHQVREAGHGADALERVRESAPDLVVTDLMMPVMDGVDLMRHLRADPATAGIPVLAATGDPQLATLADLTVTKPYRRQAIIAAAEALLTRPRTR
ncbi:response regulator [Actinokineospora sp. NBRC 105648]|uniref:response regulator n=1 Tax=Actinokineospora sp. NBRC 105648 TaxID=3032206 RepID=UPI002557776D|nr:response regulator [Actinokineospora sp. NBRC 105648]